MMSDSGNHSDFLAKKARKARRKRLRIIRNRSLMDNLTPEIDQNIVKDADACKGKKRPAAADFSDFSSNVAADGINDDDELSDESGGAERIGVLVSSACEEKEPENSLINYVSYGTISLIGRRRVMEDAVTVVPGGELAIFGVYDGHGGDRVSKACELRLHQLVLEKIDGQTMLDGCSGERDWEKVMKECFSKMDEEVNSSSGGDGDGGGGMEGCSSVVTGKTVGSTAVVVVVGKKEVVVANCGDSRAVLCRGGIPVPLSHDHKPDRADERERVEAAGGSVINWNGSRILGVLATSRSIGDEHLKPYVIAEPEVDIRKRTALDEFLIIASDGLWDVVPNDFACDVARKCLNGQMRNKFTEGTNSGVAAAMLAELALARGSKDNISVIVVELNRCSSNLS